MDKLNFLFVFILSFSLNAQILIHNVNIKMKDSTVLTDQVIAIEHGLQSIKTQRLYEYHKIEKFMIKRNNKSFTYYLLDLKDKFKTEKSAQHGLGHKVYDSPKIELFHISFSTNLHRIINYPNRNLNYREGMEIFIRRKGEKHVHNIGFIDGFGWEGIHKRVKSFFNDCPNLFKKMKEKRIGIKNIIKISDLYNEYCD